MRNSLLRVAFVAVIAILAMLYMVSLLNKVPTHAVTTGAAYTSPVQNPLLADGNPQPLVDDSSTQLKGDASTQLKNSEDQQAQLARIIAEPEPQQKAILAKEMSLFVPSSNSP